MAVITCPHCDDRVEVTDLAAVHNGHSQSSPAGRTWMLVDTGIVVHRCHEGVVEPVPRTNPLVIESALSYSERIEFMDRARKTIASAVDVIELDCSRVDDVDEPTVGMLVLLSRNARLRGLGTILRRPTEHLLDALAGAYVLDRFVVRQ